MRPQPSPFEERPPAPAALRHSHRHQPPPLQIQTTPPRQLPPSLCPPPAAAAPLLGAATSPTEAIAHEEPRKARSRPQPPSPKQQPSDARPKPPAATSPPAATAPLRAAAAPPLAEATQPTQRPPPPQSHRQPPTFRHQRCPRAATAIGRPPHGCNRQWSPPEQPQPPFRPAAIAPSPAWSRGRAAQSQTPPASSGGGWAPHASDSPPPSLLLPLRRDCAPGQTCGQEQFYIANIVVLPNFGRSGKNNSGSFTCKSKFAFSRHNCGVLCFSGYFPFDIDRKVLEREGN